MAICISYWPLTDSGKNVTFLENPYLSKQCNVVIIVVMEWLLLLYTAS